MKTENTIKAGDKQRNKEVEIIVNGSPKKWDKKIISFREVVILAFGTFVDNDRTCYTVNYVRGHGQKPEGSLVDGESVRVKRNMIFNVTATDKS